MKKSENKSTRARRKKLVLRRDTTRTLSHVSGGFTEGGGDNTACTGNDTGCVEFTLICPIDR